MKNLILASLLLVTFTVQAQQFDVYGPEPFGDILENSYNQPWPPTPIPAIQNRKYIVLMDQSSSNAVYINPNDITTLSMQPADAGNLLSTYGSVMRGIFQLVDINTHEDNASVPLAGQYRINPFLHSYYALNAASSNAANTTDGGSFYINESTETGYVVVEFSGSPTASTVKAISQWTYDAGQGEVIKNTSWTTKWLKIDGSNLQWTATESEASSFFLADATGLMDLEIPEGSDFNPLAVEYQLNATATLPEVTAMEDSPVINDLEKELDASLTGQLGNSDAATTAASAMLDAIETSLTASGASMRYPKEFYLAARESMLSQVIASTDVFNGRTGYNTIGHVYFTNATDDAGVPHPFMVLATHAVSTRPNQLVDVSRPPGADEGVGYGESSVTRNGKLGEFLVKIPLKDYGLIENLLDNDLSPYGDLASDFDDKHNTTTTKSVYNYTSLASVGMAIDGVTIYPAYNNNLRFAVEDGEVTHSGIHVGAGLELHYHADGHAFSGNGINLYNLADYVGHDHPPVIGMAYDGIALFGRYEESYPAMKGYNVDLDEFGGHDHGDGFGYHYHAHTQNVESGEPGTSFNENFLLVGAWKGNINNIPGFEEGKFNQFREPDIARYVGASYEEGEQVTGLSDIEIYGIDIYPNPTSTTVHITSKNSYDISIYDSKGALVSTQRITPNGKLTLKDLPEGVYILKAANHQRSFETRFVVKK